jgi:translation initiation factor 2 alpha subunit (eIF-2alpha)
MAKFIVEVYRDGKWWMADIAALDLLTQARRIANIEQAAREAIAVTLDVDPRDSEVEIRMRPISNIDVDTIRAEIHRVHEAATVLEIEASVKSKELTQRLAQAGVPLRDIGTIIGFSHQRAHQLLKR